MSLSSFDPLASIEDENTPWEDASDILMSLNPNNSKIPSPPASRKSILKQSQAENLMQFTPKPPKPILSRVTFQTPARPKPEGAVTQGTEGTEDIVAAPVANLAATVGVPESGDNSVVTPVDTVTPSDSTVTPSEPTVTPPDTVTPSTDTVTPSETAVSPSGVDQRTEPNTSQETQQSQSTKTPQPADTPAETSAEKSSDPLEELRQLDEEENWRERTTVITPDDHSAYVETAEEVVKEIVHDLPIKSPAKNPEVAANLEKPISVPSKGDETFEDEFVDAEESLGLSTTEEPQTSQSEAAEAPPSEEKLQTPVGEVTSDTPAPTGGKVKDTEVVAPTDAPSADVEGAPSVTEAPEVLASQPVSKPEPEQQIQEIPTNDVPQVQPTPVEAESIKQEEKSEAKSNPPAAEAPPLTLPTEEPVAMDTENEAPPGSPPLPARGSYNLDFDAFDENVNPFASKSKMGFSPPKNGDLSSVNPFQTKSKMANTPPGSPKVIRANPADNGTTDFAPPTEPPMDNSNGTSNDTSTTPSTPAGKTPVKKTPKKKEGPGSSTKKAVQKRPKFRPPSVVKKDDDDEIQIFAPGVNNNKKEVVTEDDIQIMLPPSKNNSKNDSKNEEVALETENGFSNSQESAMSISDSLPAVEKRKSKEVMSEEPSPIPEQPEVLAEDVPVAPSQQPTEELDLTGEDDFQPASSEMFNDSAAWDMLDKFGGEGDDFKSSALARQSLYVKFDPLVKGQSPGNLKGKGKLATIPAAVQGEGDDLLLMSTPPQRNAEPKVSKTPVTKAKQTPKGGAAEVDRLFNDSLSQNSHEAKPEVEQTPAKQVSGEMDEETDGIIQVLKYSQSDVNRMMKELMMENKLQMAKKDEELEKCRKSVTCLEQVIKDMRMQEEAIVEALQKAKADKDTDTSASHKSMQALMQERDSTLEDLKAVEDAFANLHQRYERSKQVLIGHRKNEDVLKKCVLDYQDKLKTQEERYTQLKKESEQKLQMANEEIEKQAKTNSSQMAVIQAALKKAEVKISSLESILEQKTKESQELTAICDELFAKVGDS